MTTSEYLTAVNDALRGTDEEAPTIGSDEANNWIRTLNRKKNELYNNAKVLWRASWKSTAPNEPGTVATTGTTTLTGTNTKFNDYRVGDKVLVSGETVRTIATITSDTVLTVTVAFSNTASGKTFTRQTIIATGVEDYNLHRSFIALSDQVNIYTTSSTYVYYDALQPKERPTTSRKVFAAGMNPQTLSFTSDIASTEIIVGGTLNVPGYYMPDDVSTSDEDADIPLPDPYWGVMATASEIAFNDITYEDRAEGLNAKANALYNQMLRNNRRGTYGNPRKSPTDIYHIRGTEVS